MVDRHCTATTRSEWSTNCICSGSTSSTLTGGRGGILCLQGQSASSVTSGTAPVCGHRLLCHVCHHPELLVGRLQAPANSQADPAIETMGNCMPQYPASLQELRQATTLLFRACLARCLLSSHGSFHAQWPLYYTSRSLATEPQASHFQPAPILLQKQGLLSTPTVSLGLQHASA